MVLLFKVEPYNSQLSIRFYLTCVILELILKSVIICNGVVLSFDSRLCHNETLADLGFLKGVSV